MTTKKMFPWDEIRGEIENIETTSGRVEITVQGRSVVVNVDDNNKLKRSVGKKVSILKTETTHHVYLEGGQ